MTTRTGLLLTAFLCLVPACAAQEGEGDDSDQDADAGGGRPTPPTRDASDGSPDAGDASAQPGDTGGGGDTGTPNQDTGPTRPDVGPPPDGPTCTATTLTPAIACQVNANAGAVDAFCDCFTERGYAGDRAACEADQPSAEDFEPSPCVRTALLRDEPATVRHSVCYAQAIDAWAACLRPCPPTREDFDACVASLDAGFVACDALLPAAVTEAITACDTTEPDPPPTDVSEATRDLQRQRDDWAATLCACPGNNGAPDALTCRSQLTDRWDPGLSPCEQAALAVDLTTASPFVTCLEESFLIAATACMECPSPVDFEYELCADPGLDIQFCFDAADPGLQQRLLDCGGR